MRELWWDVRPHPGFGTVEIRVCDAMATLDEILALAALAQCLVADLNTRFDAGEPLPRLPRWALKENKWRAARWGMDAVIIGTDGRIGSGARGTCTPKWPGCAHTPNSSAAPTSWPRSWTSQPNRIRAPQRRIAEQQGSLEAVTRDLVERWPLGAG